MFSAATHQAIKQQIDAESYNTSHIVPDIKYKLALLYDFHHSGKRIIVLNANELMVSLHKLFFKFTTAKIEQESLMMYRKRDVALRNANDKVHADLTKPTSKKQSNVNDGYESLDCIQSLGLPILNAFALRGEIMYVESAAITFSFTVASQVETVNVGDHFFNRHQNQTNLKMNDDTLLSLTWQDNTITLHFLKINQNIAAQHMQVSLAMRRVFTENTQLKNIFHAIFLPYLQTKRLKFLDPYYQKEARLLLECASRGEEDLEIKGVFDLLAKMIFDIHCDKKSQDSFFFMACDLIGRCNQFEGNNFAEKFRAMLIAENKSISHQQTALPAMNYMI